jgi:AcrR family transcriptional regulator
LAKTAQDGNDRRAAILDAARFLGLRLGMKGVTVEAIAREARVAKPTLYSYFSNKDEIFAGVMEGLIAEMKQAFQAALREEGSLSDRLARAITAKHMATMRLLEGSPHAAELYSEHDRVAGPQFKVLEEFIEAAIVEEMRHGRIDQPEALAWLLTAATYGVAAKARSPAQLSWGIDIITRQLLASANK